MASNMEYTEEDVKGHLEQINRDEGFHFQEIKEEQVKVITSILNGVDTIAVLPTGYGKTFCIIGDLLIRKKLHPEHMHTCVIVSPLLALMKEQTATFRRYGMNAMMLSSSLTQEEVKEIRNGTVEVILSSPETLLKDRWRKIIPKTYGQQLCTLVYDEAHCISEWGEDFRPDYKRVSEIQNIIVATSLVLTATATRPILKDIENELCLTDFKVVSTLPNRTNITLERLDGVERLETLHWIVDHVRENGTNSKKMLIFMNSVLYTSKLFDYLEEELGDKAFVDGFVCSSNRIIEMYSAGTDSRDQERIQQRFSEPSGTLRIVFATVAFGMGINIPDIDMVIQWGLPRSPLQFWQQVGRAGRDGRRSLSVTYVLKRSLTVCESKEMLEFTSADNTCLRLKVLKHFCISEDMQEELEGLRQNRECDECTAETEATTLCTCANCMCCTVCMDRCLKKISSILEVFLKY